MQTKEKWDCEILSAGIDTGGSEVNVCLVAKNPFTLFELGRKLDAADVPSYYFAESEHADRLHYLVRAKRHNPLGVCSAAARALVELVETSQNLINEGATQ